MKRTTLLLAPLIVTGIIGCSSGSSSKGGVSLSTTTKAPANPGRHRPQPRRRRGRRGVIGMSRSAARSRRGTGSQTSRRSAAAPTATMATSWHRRSGLNLTDVSCGAAVIPNVLDEAQGAAPPQIDAVTPDTKLITVSVGGNDINLNGTALGCGDPATVCSPPATLDADEAALQGELVAMLTELKARAPSAVVVLVTYPREFPDETCAELSLSDGEPRCSVGWAKARGGIGLGRGAGRRRPGRPVRAAWRSHRGAPASARWTAGYKVAPGEGFAYHPTVLDTRRWRT